MYMLFLRAIKKGKVCIYDGRSSIRRQRSSIIGWGWSQFLSGGAQGSSWRRNRVSARWWRGSNCGPANHCSCTAINFRAHAQGGENWNIERFKARLVVLGNLYKFKALKKTLEPTMHYVVLRIIISLDSLMGAVIRHTDVKTVFLNGILNTTIYIEQPAGYEVADPAKKGWRLNKALHGQVEAPWL